MSTQTAGTIAAEHVSKEELERILAVQREAFLREGPPSAEVRRNRIDRLMLAILEAADPLAEALEQDYGRRPVALSKMFDVLSWLSDAKVNRENLDEWMKPVVLEGPPPAFIEQKPKGVVGVMGAWNFPISLTIHPAFAALAAGNRVMMKFPENHPRTGRVLAQAVAKYFAEDEVAVLLGCLETAKEFSTLPLDHIVLTGSPAVGKAVASAAAKNLVPVTLELGGKNPVVLGRDANLEQSAERLAIARAMNGGQVCSCPEYVFVPRANFDTFKTKLEEEFRKLFPTFLDNPAAVAIVNDRNYDRITALIDDATAKGATKLQVVAADEAKSLPSQDKRLIPPTILTDVPAEAKINDEEVFGPVISLFPYDDISEAIDYIQHRPAALCAYYYGEDGDDFQAFVRGTTSGGVTRNDCFAHQTVPGAPFGGVGQSGYGAYHGKAGFDELTHRRTVAAPEGGRSFAEGSTGQPVLNPEVEAGVDQLIAGEVADLQGRLGL
ncbi:aldehyde dehydrogenase family protein [Streptomyces sp. NBC_01320]|uniref:aldehyde dehydrogenase family protein n=1 Tax=Streptomyces sp. NBC_01320 TaxID=2903824 RepID=UPI002E131D7F|nr:aldehyde dehydrogenase family protein [Streptomyces sp. NBC_01320]